MIKKMTCQLKKISSNRGDLYVVEGDFLNHMEYYLITYNFNKLLNKNEVSVIVIRGRVRINNKILTKGLFLLNQKITNISFVSDDLILLTMVNTSFEKIIGIEELPKQKFSVKRIFFVDNMPIGSVRGQHAHSVETEFLYSVNGDFEVEIKDIGEFKGVLKKGESIVSLPGAWTSVKSISDDGILLAFLSHKYDASGFTY